MFQCSRRLSQIYKPLVGYKIFVLYRVSVKCPGKTAGAGRGFCFAIGSRFSLSRAALRAKNHRVVYRRHRGVGRTKGRAAPRCARRGVRPVVGGSKPRSCKAPISPGYTSRQPRGPWKGGSSRQHGKGRALLGSHSAGVAPPLHPAGAVSPVSSAHGQRNRGTTPPGLRSGSRPASRSVERWAGPICDSIVFSKFYLTNRCHCGIIRLHRRRVFHTPPNGPQSTLTSWRPVNAHCKPKRPPLSRGFFLCSRGGVPSPPPSRPPPRRGKAHLWRVFKGFFFCH